MARTIAKDDDLIALWNKAYPNASVANADTLAQTQQAVDDMTLRDRIWDAFNYTYGVQRRQSDEAYASQISKQNNSMLNRGMQRSSYGAATEANLRSKQVQAQNDIYSQQIAAYEQALMNVEQQEQEQANWEKQFAESVRQFDILHPQQAAVGGGGGGGTATRSSGRKTNNTKDDQDGNDWGGDTNAPETGGNTGGTSAWEQLGKVAGAIGGGIAKAWDNAVAMAKEKKQPTGAKTTTSAGTRSWVK